LLDYLTKSPPKWRRTHLHFGMVASIIAIGNERQSNLYLPSSELLILEVSGSAY
jgi:hypothetical protein